MGKKGVPQSFSLVVANPAGMGSRHGLSVDQKIYPDQLARLDVETKKKERIWHIRTLNVLRFNLARGKPDGATLDVVVVDDDHFSLPPQGLDTEFAFERSDDGVWSVRQKPLRVLHLG